MVEGLACELARYLRLFVGAGFAVGRLSLCGTAAASRVTPQIVADVTNLPVACVDVSDVSALGAAMIAYVLAETGADLADLAQRWSASQRVVHPGPNSTIYRDLLEQYLHPFHSTEKGT